MRKLKASLIILVGLVVLVPSSVISQRTSVSRLFPVYDNGGKPDLVVDPQRFSSQMEIVDRFFGDGTCALEEGAVGGAGYRRLLRFDTVVMTAAMQTWSSAIAAIRITLMPMLLSSLPATVTSTSKTSRFM